MWTAAASLGEAGYVELTGPSPASARMSRQRRRDTHPEVSIRSLLWAAGLRYRVNYPVPGMSRRTIDIAFPRRRLAVFIDGCFWHSCPEHGTSPQTNGEWWATKLARNVERDTETSDHLASLGWTVERIWEHERPEAAAERITAALRVLP